VYEKVISLVCLRQQHRVGLMQEEMQVRMCGGKCRGKGKKRRG
jgi:hypothetical protein